MALILGIDVGGSRTRALLCDGKGEALGLGEAGAGNHENVGYDGLRRALRAAIETAFSVARESAAREGAASGREDLRGSLARGVAGLDAAGLGVAGFDWESERADTMAAILDSGIACPVELRNDAALGLLAGAKAGWGLNLVAGTSNNCYGLARDGREGRLAGLSGLGGENGGGTEIAGRALVAVNHARILRGPGTRLTEALCRLTGAPDADALVEGVALGRFSPVAAWAPEVFRTAREGDPVALGIIDWAGRELGESAAAVVRQLRFEEEDFEVVLSGSLFSLEPRLEDRLLPVLKAVAPKARTVHLGAPPVIGAAVLGARVLGLDTEAFLERLFGNFRLSHFA